MAKRLNALLTKTVFSTKLADHFGELAERYGIKLILANNEMTNFHIVSQLTTLQKVVLTKVLKMRKPNITITFSAEGEHFTKQLMGPIYINN